MENVLTIIASAIFFFLITTISIVIVDEFNYRFLSGPKTRQKRLNNHYDMVLKVLKEKNTYGQRNDDIKDIIEKKKNVEKDSNKFKFLTF